MQAYGQTARRRGEPMVHEFPTRLNSPRCNSRQKRHVLGKSAAEAVAHSRVAQGQFVRPYGRGRWFPTSIHCKHSSRISMNFSAMQTLIATAALRQTMRETPGEASEFIVAGNPTWPRTCRGERNSRTASLRSARGLRVTEVALLVRTPLATPISHS